MDCKIIEFLSSEERLVCETPKFPSIGKWKIQVTYDDEIIKMIVNNKFLVFDQFSPIIRAIRTTTGVESYFYGVGDEIAIHGIIDAETIEESVCNLDNFIKISF